MRRFVLVPVLIFTLAGLALAEPGVTVRRFDSVTQIQLDGDYPSMRYTVWRADAAEGPFTTAVTELGTLCIGACFAEDHTAEPGHTYWYRFDLEAQDGTRTSYGPFPVTIDAIPRISTGIRLAPNPGSGPTRVELRLPGLFQEGPLPGVVTLHDLQGRVVRTIHRGPVQRGVGSFVWDGCDANGRRLDPGCYFVRFATPIGFATARVVRVR